MGAWRRAPRPEWKEHREEDLFHCFKCKTWRPWFYYTMAGDAGHPESYLDFEKMYYEDDGGWVHACNECVSVSCQKLVRHK
jgi:hypothetical protein